MAKLVSLVFSLLTLNLALATALCVDSYSGPSPYEYSLDKLITKMSITKNLVAGWRQYKDQLIYRGNLTIPVDRFGGNDQKAQFVYPPYGKLNATFTHITSVDSSGKGINAGIAYLTRGGVGFRNVAIGYTYQGVYGLAHNIEIYGSYL